MKNGKSVVAAGHGLTASAAAEILEDGGNAFDAVVAATLMAFVAEAVFSSPGGGGFLMARRSGSDTVTLYDYFAETPLQRRPGGDESFYSIHADFGPAKQEFHIGLGASATPGMVPGLFAVHEALCTLPMKRLAEPAVRTARAGFPVSAFQAYLFTVIAPILTASAGIGAIFAPDGKLLETGETFRNPGLGEALAWLAEDGARLFDDGDIGQAIVAQSRELGGHLTQADLDAYRAERRAPLTWRHGDAAVSLNPPPAASGALIAFGLAYLDALVGEGRPLDALALKETMEATNEVRVRYRDDLSAGVATGVLVNEMRAAARHPASARGTTHISVIDAEGNAASSSLSNGEGNGQVVGTFGFMLNNMLGEEDVAPGGVWREGTRLSSMMAPTIIMETDGTVTALGTGGSNRIRTAVLQVALNLLDRGMDIAEAVEAPRIHVEKDGALSFEPGLSDAERKTLLQSAPAAHIWPERNLFFGGVHTARRRGDGSVEGAGDPRRGGVVVLV